MIFPNLILRKEITVQKQKGKDEMRYITFHIKDESCSGEQTNKHLLSQAKKFVRLVREGWRPDRAFRFPDEDILEITFRKTGRK